MDTKQFEGDLKALIGAAQQAGLDEWDLANSISNAIGEDYSLVETLTVRLMNSQGYLWQFLSPASHFRWSSPEDEGIGWEDVEGPVTVIWSDSDEGEKFPSWQKAAVSVAERANEQLLDQVTDVMDEYAPTMVFSEEDRTWVIRIDN